MSEIKMMHGDPERAKHQSIIYTTADGKFKYQLDMDYAKDLPEDIKTLPYLGNVSGGFCDAQDNLYVTLRGGGVVMNPGPQTMFVKLDQDGRYLGRLGEGQFGPVHFGNVTPEGTIMVATVMQQQVVELGMDDKIVRTIGKANDGCHNKKNDPKNDIFMTRWHYGILGTEPFHGMDFGTYQQMKDFENTEFTTEYFNNCNDVDLDSKGNIYVSDGYGNFAIHKFDREGNYITTFGGKGVFDAYTDTPGKFLVPHAICVDANDHIWLCDREKDAVHVFDSEGNVIAYCSHDLGQPSGIDTDGKYVYVVGRGGFLTIFDLDFNIVGELGFFNDSLRAHDLAADSKGNLYLFPTHANFEHQVIALKRIQ